VGVVTLDAAILGGDQPGLDAVLTEHVDGATCINFAGEWPSAPGAGALDALRVLPALTLAIGDAPPSLDDVFDLHVADLDAAEIIAAAFRRAPLAAVSAALLLRHPPPSIAGGLVAESTTYSMLQGGPEFAAWRRTYDTRPATDHDAPRVRLEEHDRATEVVLTRPQRHNAVDVAMRDQLHAALAEARWRDRPVLVRGDGPSFCSGGDLDEFATFPDPVRAHVVRLTRSLANDFAELSPRLVAAVHGRCLGAGIELPAFAAHVVAASDTAIGLPEQALGLVPGAGGTVSITRRGGRRATLSLLLRDGTITAPEAHRWGLVDHVVPASDLRRRALEIAESLT